MFPRSAFLISYRYRICIHCILHLNKTDITAASLSIFFNVGENVTI